MAEEEDSKFTTSLLNIGPVDLSSSSFSSTFPLSSPRPPPAHPSSQQAQHSPTLSFHVNNPSLRILAARQSIAADVAEAAAAETGKGNNSEKEYLPVGVLRMVLGMRDHRGVAAGEIEKRLGLKKGVVKKLGREGVVGLVGGDDGRR